ASGSMGCRCSISMEPTDATYASLPCRATTARRPGSFPESTYACSAGPIRSRAAAERPTSAGRARGRPCVSAAAGEMQDNRNVKQARLMPALRALVPIPHHPAPEPLQVPAHDVELELGPADYAAVERAPPDRLRSSQRDGGKGLQRRHP